MAVIKRRRSTEKETISSENDLLQIYTNVPIPVDTITNKLDIEIKYEDNLDNETSGYIKFDNNQWTIGVNAKHHANRQRFTIAHELGHYMLHKQHIMKEGIMKDSILFRKGEKNNLEIAANNFASNLLIPEEEFERKINGGMTSIDELSKHFEVSSLAIRYRAKKLGYDGHGV